MTQTSQFAAQRFLHQQFPNFASSPTHHSVSTNNATSPQVRHQTSKIFFENPIIPSGRPSSARPTAPVSTWSLGGEQKSSEVVYRNGPYVMDPRPIQLSSIKKPPPPKSNFSCISKRIKSIEKKYKLDIDSITQLPHDDLFKYLSENPDLAANPEINYADLLDNLEEKEENNDNQSKKSHKKSKGSRRSSLKDSNKNKSLASFKDLKEIQIKKSPRGSIKEKLKTKLKQDSNRLTFESQKETKENISSKQLEINKSSNDTLEEFTKLSTKDIYQENIKDKLTECIQNDKSSNHIENSLNEDHPAIENSELIENINNIQYNYTPQNEIVNDIVNNIDNNIDNDIANNFDNNIENNIDNDIEDITVDKEIITSQTSSNIISTHDTIIIENNIQDLELKPILKRKGPLDLHLEVQENQIIQYQIEKIEKESPRKKLAPIRRYSEADKSESPKNLNRPTTARPFTASRRSSLQKESLKDELLDPQEEKLDSWKVVNEQLDYSKDLQSIMIKSEIDEAINNPDSINKTEFKDKSEQKPKKTKSKKRLSQISK